MRLRLGNHRIITQRQQTTGLRLPVNGITHFGRIGAKDAQGAVAAGDAQAGDAFGCRERIQSEWGKDGLVDDPCRLFEGMGMERVGM